MTEYEYYYTDTVDKEIKLAETFFFHYDEYGNEIAYEQFPIESYYFAIKRDWSWLSVGISSDASLWNVSAGDGKLKAIINNKTYPGYTIFNDEINDYIVLIDSAVINPTLTVEKNDPNSSFVVNNATDMTSANKADRIATVTVTAEDGTTRQDYSFEFHWVDHLATLDSLNVSEGKLSPEFSPDIFEYFDTLYGSCAEKVTAAPTVTFKTTSSYSYTTATTASDICGSTDSKRTSKVNVTADDGVTKNTYKVIFSVIDTVPSSFSTVQTKDLFIYPNPSQDVVYIEHIRSVSEVKVYNLMGQMLGRFETGHSKNYILDLSELRSGMYYIRVTDEESNIYTQKVIKE